MSEHKYSTDRVHEVYTGPFTISYRVRVNATVDELWPLVANPHRHYELDGSNTLSAKVTGPEVLNTGDTFNIWMRRFGLPYTLPMRVLIAQPHRQIAWQHPAQHVWRWEFEPDDGGGTWVTETFDYRQVAPLIIRVWARFGIYSSNARDIRATLQRLHNRYAG